ncbi:MAG: YceI family protein [Prolixibacteraceae bacterium]
MKKILFIAFIGLICTTVKAQNIYFTKDAKINFNSSTPVEDIVAETNQGTTFIDISKNEVKFSVLTTSFKFRRALMEEHFNENYMESSKNKEFAKAKFSGTITTPIDWKSDKMVTAEVKGDFTMHGVTKQIVATAKITPGKSAIVAMAEFRIVPQDYNIAIPSAVSDKIAKEVVIKVEATYAPYQH